MALGRPVIATTAGGLPEVVAESGMLIPPSDPQALREALLKVLGDSDLRRKFGVSGYNRARTQFAAPAMAGKLIRFYDELLSAPSNGEPA